MTLSFWYALPLVASVSLVYAATRHEDVSDILQHALRVAFWIIGFMILAFGILFAISKWVS